MKEHHGFIGDEGKKPVDLHQRVCEFMAGGNKQDIDDGRKAVTATEVAEVAGEGVVVTNPDRSKRRINR